MFSRKTFLRAIGSLIGTALAPSVQGVASRAQDKPGSDKSERFAERILSDTAAAMLAFGAYIGDRLGIFQVMSRSGPATVGELRFPYHLRPEADDAGDSGHRRRGARQGPEGLAG